jgi:hypothetical protein
MMRVLSSWACAAGSMLACAGIDERNPSVATQVSADGGAGNTSSNAGAEQTTTNAGDALQSGAKVSGSAGSSSSGTANSAGAEAPSSDAASDARSGGAAGNGIGNGMGSGMQSPSSGAPDPAPSLLMASAAAFDFGGLEAAIGSASFSWVISNAGPAPSGTLSLSTSDTAPFQAQSSCPNTLPPGGSCTIAVSFSPASAGTFASNIQFGQANQMLSLAVTGLGRYRLTVQRIGEGDVSEPSNALTCSSDSCTGLFDPGTVSVSARTQNGSGSIFTGWSSPDCAASDDCLVTLNASVSLTATFQTLSNNLIFVTSSTYPTNLGGLAAMDAECNRVASAAGINGAAGTDFIAGASDSQRSLRQRLGTARGWVRRDGLPIGDTLEEIFDQSQMLYSPILTEHGRPSADALLALTGTDPTGNASPDTCKDWTSLDSGVSFSAGLPGGSPRNWMSQSFGSLSCGGQSFALYCMGISRSAAISVPAQSGKRMWLTHAPYIPGSMTPDAFCQSQRPAGVAQAVAFVAYTNRPAAAQLDPSALYVRTDGAVVGTGSDIAALKILAGPWLTNDGSVGGASDAVWGGAEDPNVLADPTYNCNDWTSADGSGNGWVGDIDASSPRFFYTSAYTSCSNNLRAMRCVEP